MSRTVNNRQEVGRKYQEIREQLAQNRRKNQDLGKKSEISENLGKNEENKENLRNKDVSHKDRYEVKVNVRLYEHQLDKIEKICDRNENFDHTSHFFRVLAMRELRRYDDDGDLVSSHEEETYSD